MLRLAGRGGSDKAPRRVEYPTDVHERLAAVVPGGAGIVLRVR
jgi:hypothetical protein